MNKTEIKNLKYGKPTEKHLEKMQREVDLIHADADQIDIPPPPSGIIVGFLVCLT